MSPDRSIREVRPSDHSRLRTIQQATLSDPSPDLLAAAVDGPLVALVRLDSTGRIVGYVVAVAGDGRAYLPELAVAPDAQGVGHGTALLSAIRDRLREDGVETVRVTARADDSRVRAFYEERGFAAVEHVADHYADGTDGVVYECRL